ncbi:hypothetical protein [Klebsiella pneumoniae IS39]|nr:hypothetical protein [Klebsiella pneumoniae IS39]
MINCLKNKQFCVIRLNFRQFAQKIKRPSPLADGCFLMYMSLV